MKIKKYLTAAVFAACSLFITGCEDETDPGGTAVKKMAGDWWVTVDVIEGETNLGDGYGIGHLIMHTYNTAANKPTEMWLEDGGNFWDYKLRVDVQYENRTFSTAGFVDNHAYESQASITDGKILEGAATTPSGMPADSIIYYIRFDDDEPEYQYRISGFRRTGFPADDF
ncbi:MAG: hypothetical protein LBJ47_11710 [Tannerella sp.]|jgi:hypothetical protein|nr:hypothetical protein [Tannerella sp.]